MADYWTLVLRAAIGWKGVRTGCEGSKQDNEAVGRNKGGTHYGMGNRMDLFGRGYRDSKSTGGCLSAVIM